MSRTGECQRTASCTNATDVGQVLVVKSMNTSPAPSPAPSPTMSPYSTWYSTPTPLKDPTPTPSPSPSPTVSPNARSLRHEVSGIMELASSAPGRENMNTSPAASPAGRPVATARVAGQRGREPFLERGGVRAGRDGQQGQLHGPAPRS